MKQVNDNNKVMDSIAALKNLLSGGSIDFDSFQKSVPFRILYSGNYFNSGSVFRATILDEVEVLNPVHLSRFSYPDPDKGIKVTKGRANVDGIPVFYCSNTLAGAVDETVLTKSDSKRQGKPKRIFVSEWYCEKIPVSAFDLSLRIAIDQLKSDIDEIKSINQYLELIMNAYLSNNAYDFTSRWSHYLLYEKNKPYVYDLIIYPSAINKVSINYAIHPDCIKKHYQLRRVFDIRLPFELNPDDEAVKIQIGPRIGLPDTKSDRLRIVDIRPEDFDIIKAFPLNKT